MIHVTDLDRELAKIRDALWQTAEHLAHKDAMNAALHMSNTVRPTPLSSAVSTALANIDGLRSRISEGVDNTPS